MAIRYARTDALGLVVAPLKLDCVGSECRVVAREGRCYPDDHHLYFYENDFASRALTRQFREHPFNQIKTPRCRHDQYHAQVDRAQVPEDSVMTAFLDEAEILRQLGVVTKRVLSIEKMLASEETKDHIRIDYSPGGRARGTMRFQERLESFKDQQSHYLHMATKIEVVPERLILGSHVLGARAIWGTQAA